MNKWQSIVNEYEQIKDQVFSKKSGEIGSLIGVMHGEDDYYWVMSFDGKTEFYSCVGTFKAHGITPVQAEVRA